MKLPHLALALTLVAGGAAIAVSQDGQDANAMPVVEPGPEHKILERFTGTWDATIHMGPGQESKGTEVGKVALGGLWLLSDYTGEFMGTPFTGHLVMGYDAEAKHYTSIWVDSMTTHVEPYTGGWDEKTQTLAVSGMDKNPMTGEPTRTTHKNVFRDANTRHFTIELEGMDQPLLTIDYKRRK